MGTLRYLGLLITEKLFKIYCSRSDLQQEVVWTALVHDEARAAFAVLLCALALRQKMCLFLFVLWVDEATTV